MAGGGGGGEAEERQVGRCHSQPPPQRRRGVLQPRLYLQHELTKIPPVDFFKSLIFGGIFSGLLVEGAGKVSGGERDWQQGVSTYLPRPNTTRRHHSSTIRHSPLVSISWCR